jgi:hypothetical protein
VGVANDIEVRLPVVDERPDPEIVRDVHRGDRTCGDLRSSGRSTTGQRSGMISPRQVRPMREERRASRCSTPIAR